MGNRAENAELGPKRDSQGPGSDAATAWDLVPVPKSPPHTHTSALHPALGTPLAHYALSSLNV